MLDPNNRSLLTDMLQPPRGYVLSQAVGTTFTLDLASALTVPLSFASRIAPEQDDVGIIASLAQFSDRINIFTQAGEIRSGVRSDLVALLEEVVHPVHPPRGIFHPKVWFLQYRAGNRAAYRFLCLSRNLTEDRSWDLSIRLDGSPAPEEQQTHWAEVNTPLVEMLELLPELAVNPIGESRRASIAALAEDLSAVQWEHPEGVSDLRFHLLNGSAAGGSTGQDMLRWPAKDALVISPFVSRQGLQAVQANVAERVTLVSRPLTIDQLPPECLDDNLAQYVLDDLLAEVDDGGPEALSGLHAKAVFMRHRRRWSQARALIGSANITGGGLQTNIELMVEFAGLARDFGPEAVIGTLQPLLEPYESAGGEDESEADAARQALEAHIRTLAAGRFHARVIATEPFGIRVWCEPETQELVEQMQRIGVSVSWALLSNSGGPQRLSAGESNASEISGLQLSDISPFLQIVASQRVQDQRIRVTTIVQAELHNDIAGRRDAMLARGIGDGETFLKLLLLLLGSAGSEWALGRATGAATGDWSSSLSTSGLLESLLGSLARGGDDLDVAHRVFSELQEYAGDELDLPEGFTELWNNVWHVRRSQPRERVR
ncbi:phospholipase D family protein [Nesterenkonia natronophila]|uniref:PLD phosphodiesterase domain-containing protein n=1 Tax=Nesterenkonia natronophila TaxID=2174932 RepID=A0A3A4FCZ1_9MICC|nr:phospholipase D family protein [Nesterenkonia natronophila]RJN32957.1 hypothetical protein D3250_03890 [Nesterenkonia natronophila]